MVGVVKFVAIVIVPEPPASDIVPEIQAIVDKISQILGWVI